MENDYRAEYLPFQLFSLLPMLCYHATPHRFISELRRGPRPFDLYSFIKDYLELLRRDLANLSKSILFAHSSSVLKCQKVLLTRRETLLFYATLQEPLLYLMRENVNTLKV